LDKSFIPNLWDVLTTFRRAIGNLSTRLCMRLILNPAGFDVSKCASDGFIQLLTKFVPDPL
jgi:hypothetical protein